jgi:AcrR family transcriptional regulator
VGLVTSVAPTPKGRPRDASRDEVIRRAALEVLAEQGYDNLTMDLVAARAQAGKATIYRRWPSKAELVIDAMTLVKPAVASIDTGSLDTDLDALVEAGCSRKSAFASAVMAGVASALGRDPELLTAFRRRVTEPRIARIREILERARDRGEIDPALNIDFIATIVPSMILQNVILTGRSADRSYVEQVVAHALRPMLGLPPRAN